MIDLLGPVAAGVLVALVVALATKRLSGNPSRTAALALAAAFVAARVAVRAPSAFPPTYVEDWGVWLAPVFVGLALLDTSGKLAAPVAWTARALASFGLAYLYLAPNVDFRDAPLAIAANGAAVLALWAALHALSCRGPRVLLLGAHGVPALGVAIGIGVPYMASVGSIAGGLALGSAVTLALTWKAPALEVGRATTPVFVLAFATLLFSGGYYTDGFPLPALALLAASPLCAWAGDLPFLARRSTRTRVLIGAGAALCVCGLAAWLGWPPPQEDPGW